MLPPLTARRIVRHRDENGPDDSIDALQTVGGVDARLIAHLRSYLTAGPPSDSLRPYPSVPSVQSLFTSLDATVTQRATRELDPGRGYTQDSTGTTYLGSPVRLTT